MPTAKKSKALPKSIEVDLIATLDYIAELGFGVALKRLPPGHAWTVMPGNKRICPDTWYCVAEYMKPDKTVPGVIAICDPNPALLVLGVCRECLKALSPAAG